MIFAQGDKEMKKTSQGFQFFVALITLQAFLLNPLALPQARADATADFHATCDKVLKDQSTSPDTSTTGVQLLGECNKAKAAVTSRKGQLSKVVIDSVGLGLTLSGLIMTYTGTPPVVAAGKTLCTVSSAVATVSDAATDFITSSSMNSTVSKFEAQAMKTTDSLFAIGAATNAISLIPGLGGGIIGSVNMVGKATTALGSKMGANGAAKAACVMSCAMIGIELGLSTMGLVTSDSTLKTAVKSAQQEASIVNSGGLISLGGFNLQNGGGKDAAAPAPQVAAAPVATDCSTQTGDAHLTCLNNQSPSPELSAITANPAFLAAAQNALGQPLGDFVRGFNGNTAADAANYAAKGLGYSGDAAAQLASAMSGAEELAKASGLADKYTPMAYTRSEGGATAKVDDNMDFGKLMGNMLKQLNPDGSTDKTKDPSALVFRQLDLLPADKILGNKDISLFARIGYRYRKKENDVEHLNWASDQNQNRTVATETQAI